MNKKLDWIEIPGWIDIEEGDALTEYAASIPLTHAIVEIGSWMGRSTICLARGSKTFIYSIDPHRNTKTHKQFGVNDSFKAFKNNLIKFGVIDRVCILRALSQEAARHWSRIIGLLFIDGEHTYDAVKLDLELWLPFLVGGSIIMCHDYDKGTPGVVKAVKEMIPCNKYKWENMIGSLFVGRKIGN